MTSCTACSKIALVTHGLQSNQALSFFGSTDIDMFVMPWSTGLYHPKISWGALDTVYIMM
jgi:hypothetical protein